MELQTCLRIKTKPASKSLFNRAFGSLRGQSSYSKSQLQAAVEASSGSEQSLASQGGARGASETPRGGFVKRIARSFSFKSTGSKSAAQTSPRQRQGSVASSLLGESPKVRCLCPYLFDILIQRKLHMRSDCKVKP